ncbi:hypothetical protein Tco_1024889 [Tanacetum coccineum]
MAHTSRMITSSLQHWIIQTAEDVGVVETILHYTRSSRVSCVTNGACHIVRDLMRGTLIRMEIRLCYTSKEQLRVERLRISFLCISDALGSKHTRFFAKREGAVETIGLHTMGFFGLLLLQWSDRAYVGSDTLAPMDVYLRLRHKRSRGVVIDVVSLIFDTMIDGTLQSGRGDSQLRERSYCWMSRRGSSSGIMSMGAILVFIRCLGDWIDWSDTVERWRWEELDEHSILDCLEILYESVERGWLLKRWWRVECLCSGGRRNDTIGDRRSANLFIVDMLLSSLDIAIVVPADSSSSVPADYVSAGHVLVPAQP